MKMRERKQLQRLKELLTAIPLPQAGGSTQSSGFTGYVAYSQDMRQALAVYRRVLDALIYDGLEGWHEGSDYWPADPQMDGLEAWIKVRESRNWQTPSHPIEPYMVAAMLEYDQARAARNGVEVTDAELA